jgi:hypothetical protein
MEISRMLSAAMHVKHIPELEQLRRSDPSLFAELHRMQKWQGRELRTQGERPARDFNAPKLEKAKALRQLRMEKDVFLSEEVQEAMGEDNHANMQIVHARTREGLARLLGHPPSVREWQTLRAQRFHYAGDPDAAACSLQVQNDHMRQGTLEQGVSAAPDVPLFALEDEAEEAAAAAAATACDSRGEKEFGKVGRCRVKATATTLLQYVQSKQRPLIVVAGSIT